MAFLAALVLAACSTRTLSCTLVGGVPSLSIYPRAVARGFDPADVLICVEDTCQLLTVTGGDGVVRFLDEGRGSRPTIEVATTSGATLAGPTEIEFEEYYPNGKRCDPKVLRGTVIVSESGDVERVGTATN